MNIMKVSTIGEICTLNVENSVEDVLDKEFSSIYERVKPRGLGHKYCMIVDEEGNLKDLPINLIGSKLYSKELVHPIVGDIYIFKEIYNGDTYYTWEGLNDEEIEEVLNLIRSSLEI